MPKLKILITGAGGQDAFYLSRRLQRTHQAETIGLIKPDSPLAQDSLRLKYFSKLIPMDLANSEALKNLIVDEMPDAILNFGAIAGSLTQFDNPDSLIQINLQPVLDILQTIHQAKLKTTFIQASSSEIFAGGTESPQSLTTPHTPRTIYGVTKSAADNLIKVYRTTFGLNCYSAVLYSHESPLREAVFFTRNIVTQALNICEGKQEKMPVYSPDATRDWGYAGEYCNQIADKLMSGWHENYIIGSGTSTTVRSFVQTLCNYLGLNYSTVAEEKPLQEGRAIDSIKVIAAKKSTDHFFGRKLQFDIPQLIKLLVKHERRTRKN